MPDGTQHFSLVATLTDAGHAFVAVICRIGFEAAMHGLAVAGIVLSVALFQFARKGKYGKPLMVVFRKLALFCSVLAIPGTISLLTTGTLPQVNTLQLNSIGLLGFWSLVTLHLCMEEMNFQWFNTEEPQNEPESEESAVDKSPVTASGK